MPTFKYKAVDASGKHSEGELAANDRPALVDALRQQGLTVVHMEEATETGRLRAAAAQEEEAPKKSAVSAILGSGVSRKDLTVLTRQLATTLHAGLPLLRIIHVLHRECTHKALRGVLEKLGQSIQKGKRFSDALAEHPQIFDETYLNMVKVGETGGSLPDCMGRLALLLEKEMRLRNKVKSALSYPIFVFIFTGLMTYGLMAFLMPMFAPMFSDSGLNIERDYPLTYYLLIASSLATNSFFMGCVVGGMILAFFAFRVAASTKGGQYVIDYLRFNPPFFTGFTRKVVAARFSRNFSLLLKSGVHLVQALTLVSGASGNEVVKSIINKAAKHIQEGGSISNTIKSTGIFPDLMIQMTTMGEEAGTLADMLERCADYFDDEVDSEVAGITALLEPGMMVLIGCVVAVFVMGVLLPILGISTGQMNKM